MTQQLDKWQKGQPITAKRLQGMQDAIVRQDAGLPSQQPGGENPLAMVIAQMKISSISGDYLTCTLWDGANEGGTVYVARPYLLRTSIDERNSIDFTYSDNQTREADDGSDTEDQVIVPSYIVGDIIYAIRNINGGTNVQVSSENVIWLDMNLDGRAWAKAAA